MRIIGGKCKGRRLNAPKSIKARPTTDFAKERIIEATNEGKRVADTLREEFEDKSES